MHRPVDQELAIQVRKYQRQDRRAVLRIAAESFAGVCLDENIEMRFGRVGDSWQAQKKEAVDYDLTHNAGSAFVAAQGGEVIGFVCNRLYYSRSIGHVANLAVAPSHQGKGVGKALMRASLDHFRREGMRYARIETLEQNRKGQKFYPSLGFQEVGRQIFYFMKL